MSSDTARIRKSEALRFRSPKPNYSGNLRRAKGLFFADYQHNLQRVLGHTEASQKRGEGGSILTPHPLDIQKINQIRRQHQIQS